MNKPSFYISLLLIVAGLGIGLWFFIDYSQAIESENWPTTTGKIVSLTVIERKGGVSGRFGSWGPSWSPRVEYLYTVDGVKYSNNRIKIGVIYFDTEAAAKWYMGVVPSIIGDVPELTIVTKEGATDTIRIPDTPTLVKDDGSVEVYYNPENPQDSILIPGMRSNIGVPGMRSNPGVFIRTAFSGLFIILGLVGLFLIHRNIAINKNNIEKVYQIVEDKPGISHTALIKSTAGIRSSKSIIKTLVREERIKCEESGRVRRYFIKSVDEEKG